MSEQKFLPGDWVRFYRDATLVIGVVQYSRYLEHLFRWELLTDRGSITDQEVLEMRRESAKGIERA